MSTVIECSLILFFFGLIVLGLKKIISQKKRESLTREIENDIHEEFPSYKDSEEFLSWAEDLQMEDDIARRGYKG